MIAVGRIDELARAIVPAVWGTSRRVSGATVDVQADVVLCACSVRVFRARKSSNSGRLEERYRGELRPTSLRADDESDQLAWASPSMAKDDSFRAWWISAGHRGASPSTARRLLQVLALADVTVELEAVACPVLVIQRTGSAAMPVEAGRFVVRHSANARLVELPGSDLLCWVDAEDTLGEISWHGPGCAWRQKLNVQSGLAVHRHCRVDEADRCCRQ